MRVFMKIVNADYDNNSKLSLMEGGVQRKFKIPIAAIGISTPTSH